MGRATRRCVPAALALVLAATFAFTGCGDDGPSDAQARAVGETALEDADLDVDTHTEICIGRSLIDDLGEADARKAAHQGDLADLPKDQQKAAVASLDECVPGRTIAKGVVRTFMKGATTKGSGADVEPAGLVDCLTKEFEGKAGDIVLEASKASAKESDQVFLRLLAPCPTDELVAAAVSTGLQKSGLPAAVIDCVGPKVAARVTLAQLVTEDPTAVQTLQAAVNECAGANG
jgi:hypothetical protein